MRLLLILLFFVVSCSDKKELNTPEICANKIIYGKNDLSAVNDTAQTMKEASASVAGMIQSTRILRDFFISSHQTEPSEERYQVFTSPIEHFMGRRNSLPMCNNSINQLGSAINCTGFLIGEDLLVTAGHCLSRSNDKRTTSYKCQKYEWVFGLESEDDFRDHDGFYIRDENRFKCKEVLAFKNDGKSDYAVIRLDRKVLGRRPLKLKSSRSQRVNSAIYTIGFPYGSPMKISPNGKFIAQENGTNFFNTKIDTFPSFSGAPIIDQYSHEVIGIHVNGLSNPLENVGGCLDFSRRCENEENCASSQAQNIDSITNINSLVGSSSLSSKSSCN